MLSLRSIVRPASASLTWSASSRAAAARPLAATVAQRWNSTDSKQAEDAKKTAEKVESTAGQVEQKVKELESQIKDLRSQLTYGKADFINLQKRSESEKLTAREFAIQKFALDLIGTVDILGQALKHVAHPIAPENTGLKSLYDGVSLTKNELVKTLERHGVTEFDPMGEKFDPNVHEAIFQAPIPDKEAGTVFDVQKTGYMYKTRTLRPAQVGVVQETS